MITAFVFYKYRCDLNLSSTLTHVLFVSNFNHGTLNMLKYSFPMIQQSFNMEPLRHTSTVLLVYWVLILCSTRYLPLSPISSVVLESSSDMF